MDTATETAIARLLEETLAAHSAYETTTLGGVYDEEWSSWYAIYLLDHGLPDVLRHVSMLDAAELGAILRQLDADYRREQPTNEWPAYYANRLGAMPP